MVAGSRSGDIAGADEWLPYPAEYATAYPATEAEAERLVLAAKSPDLQTIALRPHLIWGPGDNHLIPRIITRARTGRLRRIKFRDSIYIDNAATAHLCVTDRLTEASSDSPPAGRAYTLSNNDPRPFWDLVNGILLASGSAVDLAHFAGGLLEGVYRSFDIPGRLPMTRFVAHQLLASHLFKTTAASLELGYTPNVTIDDGLLRLQA